MCRLLAFTNSSVGVEIERSISLDKSETYDIVGQVERSDLPAESFHVHVVHYRKDYKRHLSYTGVESVLI